MKDVFNDAIESTKQCGHTSYQCIKEKVLDFMTEKTSGIIQSEKIDLGYFYEYWKYIAALTRLYSRVQEEDWKINDIGSFFIKILNSANGNNGIKWNWDISCDSIREDVLTKVHEIFGNFSPEINLLEMAYLYTLNDFTTSIEKETWLKNDAGLQPPSNLMNFNFDIISCIQDVANKSEDNKKKQSFYDGRVHKYKKDIHNTPCANLKKFSTCKSYCHWHQKYFNGKNKQEFLTIMKYAMPQRKMVMESTISEKELARKIFGESHLKDSPKLITPMSMPIFCHKVGVGFYGEDGGILPKVCSDFFPTPTDQGICLTQNLELDEIMQRKELYEDMFETSKQSSKSKIDGGTLLSEITFVIFTDSGNPLSQSYPRESGIQIGEIKFQLHQPNEFAKILIGNNYETDLIPLTLNRGTEYFIKVSPKGQVVSQSIRDIKPMQRKCHLEEEVSVSSVFKVYTENNCLYDCYVTLSQEQCKCIPWDFFTKTIKYHECDVFGRSCFYGKMANLIQAPENHCLHCIKECNYIKYNKIVEKAETLPSTYGDKETFFDYILDKNNVLVEEGFKRGFDSFLQRDSISSNKNYTNLRKRFIADAIIVHLNFQKPDVTSINLKYSTDDKFANFGGSFGIFAEIIGCSFLGLLNIFIICLKILMSSIKT